MCPIGGAPKSAAGTVGAERGAAGPPGTVWSAETSNRMRRARRPAFRLPGGHPDIDLASALVVGERRFWGWGYEEEGLTEGERLDLVERVRPLLGGGVLEPVAPPEPAEIRLGPPRIAPSACPCRVVPGG